MFLIQPFTPTHCHKAVMAAELSGGPPSYPRSSWDVEGTKLPVLCLLDPVASEPQSVTFSRLCIVKYSLFIEFLYPVLSGRILLHDFHWGFTPY